MCLPPAGGVREDPACVGGLEKPDAKGGKAPPEPEGGIVVAYNRALRASPLRTKALTAAAVAFAADLLAQRLVARKASRLNVRRAGLMALFGAAWSGPSLHLWQARVESLFWGQPATLATAARKAALDQVTYGPMCNALLIAYLATVVNGEGSGPRFALGVVRERLPGATLKGWQLWPAAALVNYRYVPVEYRAAFMNVVGLVWGVTLTLSASRAAKK